MSQYYVQKITPCECGSKEPYWHGPKHSDRVYCCDACWAQELYMTPKPPLVHLTLTGPAAGTPFCGVDKQTARAKGEQFSHVPYSHVKEFLARPEICPACKAEWDNAE